MKKNLVKYSYFGNCPRSEIFRVMADIYKSAMDVHGITGDVPISVMLAEDETKVKAGVAWEQKWDTLSGLCGPKENHVCTNL